jgi:hypothetical protein
MQQVVRHTVIDEIEKAVTESPLVTVSAVAAGGGVGTALNQWIEHTTRPTTFGTCPDLNPQRPLAAFGDVPGEASVAIRQGDWPSAARRLARGQAETEEPTVFVVDNADRLDEASARLIGALLALGCRVVLGHHHAPSTNPSLELLIEATPTDRQRPVIVPPFTKDEVDEALGDGVDSGAARAATGGNPLALSLYRRSGFASIAVEVLERFDRLPADGQALAAILAASPEPVPLDLLEAMARPWERHRIAFDRSDLAAVDETGIAIRHGKIRRVLYEEMTAVRRRFVHAEILGHLSETDDLTTVMHHAVGAGDVESIITLGPKAAALAADVGAHREAARHLENVLAYEHSIPEADREAIKEALDSSLGETVG